MKELLDSLKRSLLANSQSAVTAEELQAAAALAKTVAEAEKANVEAQNNLKQIHLERLKSWSALLIPIISLLALLGTVVTQTIQLRQQADPGRARTASGVTYSHRCEGRL